MMATLTQDPITGMWSGNATGAGGATGPTLASLNGGPAPAASSSSGSPDAYTVFNQNMASLLTQIQKASSAGAAKLGAAKDALTTEGIGAGGGYNPAAAPSVNLQDQQGTFGAFAPAITDVNTQLSNANTAIGSLGNEITGLETAYAPTTVSPGQSTVTPNGQTVVQGHSYTPEINPETGLMDGFDQNTGTWASADGAGGGGNGAGAGTGAPQGPTSDSGGSSTPTGSLEGILGASNPIGAYASDPHYVQEITGLYGTIAGLGVTQSPDTLQQYIANNAKGSPVTGQMVINASNTYGVDPSLLTAILLHESDFGTAGAATTTMNPGNVGNTGSSTMTFKSWQAGVMATANNLAMRIAKATSTGLATAGPQQDASATVPPPQSTVGGNFSAQAAQKVAALPQVMQTYVSAGPLGVAYINGSAVPQQEQAALQTLSAKNGIPYFTDGQDVSNAKAITAVLSNLDSMQKLAETNLSTGGGLGPTAGHAEDSLLGGLNEWAQTGWGQNLGLFDNYRDTAIKAVQALAGGQGSGLRINAGEIAANTQNLPQASDSQQNAIVQIKQLRQMIYTQLATTFPYAMAPVVNPSGQPGSIPLSNLDAAIQQGYTLQ